MASIGCDQVNWKGTRGVPTFTVNGPVYHRIGSYWPSEDKPPMFSQFYVWDPEDDAAL